MKTLILLAAILSCSQVPAWARQPNFLFLLSDDQSWNGLSCRMHPEMPRSRSSVIETPNLAGLAEQGMRFSAAYSPASVCAPTRISLQTGKSPAQCRWTKAAASMTAADGFKLVPPPIRRNIEEGEVTVAELLKSAGYATAHFGKWHLGGGGPEVHGYEESDGSTGNQHAAPHVDPNPVDIFGMGSRAKAFMERNSKAGRPFFIQMSYHALHYPENASRAMMRKYQELIPGGYEKEIGRAAISEDLDRGVGELLEKLAELGLEETTYVIYMSDNGGSTRGTLRGGKGGVWEGGIRVPLIIRGPGIAANSWCHQRVVGYDFYPTFCKLGGVTEPLPDGIEGGLLTGLFGGENEPVKRPREELVFHFPHYQGDRPHTALFWRNYKLLRFYEDDSLFLYEISSDLGEEVNLASEKRELAAEMKARMEVYLTEVDAAMPVENSQYDPNRPPSLKQGKGDRRGKGKGKGKGKGGKRRMAETGAQAE